MFVRESVLFFLPGIGKSKIKKKKQKNIYKNWLKTKASLFLIVPLPSNSLISPFTPHASSDFNFG